MANLQIKFIGELPGALPPRTLLVATDQDYCAASVELRRDLATGYDAIWIRQSHHFAWMQSLCDHVGLSHLRPAEFTRTTARDLLASNWKLPMPAWLTDEMILSEELLDRELPTGHHEHVASVLLASAINPISLISPKFPRTQAGMLAEQASAPALATALAGSAVVKAAWENTLSSWADAEPSSWVTGFCERLRANAKQLYCDLTVWRLLQKYPPEALEFALDPTAVIFVRSVPADVLQGMSLNEDGRTLAMDQIVTMLEQARSGVATRAKFEALLNAVSGELLEEFNGLEAVLALDSFKSEPRDVDTIARWFKSCPEVTPAALAKLELYIRPNPPTALDPASADAAAWVKWFHAEYAPYRWWQMQRLHADAAVETTVAAFSEWYCRDFIKVHGQPDLSAVQTMSQWRPSILKDSISLILLVDNLPWFFWDAFERAFAAAGLHKHSSANRFVSLPSHTSVCKPALVSGKWEVGGTDYLKMLEARSADEWNARQVVYLSGVDQLGGLKAIPEPVVLLLNYLASDEALHSDTAAAGTTPAEQLNLLYKSLATAINQFAKRASQNGRIFGLYVLTDHGSTCVLPAEKASADAVLVKRLFPNEKYRSASVTSEEAAVIPENLWALGHRFVNPYQTEGLVHFIPKGHSTVASPGPRPLYSHGGATPEEVIIPTGVFRIFRAVWLDPGVRFLNLKLKDGRGVFYVKRIATIEVEIQNNNRDECRLESVGITPNVGEVRNFERAVVPPNATGKSTVSLYFGQSATSTQTLAFTFTFRIAQETLTRRIELPVMISSAAAGGTDLTNLFT
ncbi:MAG: hypothetical protein O2960_17750 [Verrucomicrobia bacterium]|nr:hypothetical protein [Verrucomicrobiota bacterium]